MCEYIKMQKNIDILSMKLYNSATSLTMLYVSCDNFNYVLCILQQVYNDLCILQQLWLCFIYLATTLTIFYVSCDKFDYALCILQQLYVLLSCDNVLSKFSLTTYFEFMSHHSCWNNKLIWNRSYLLIINTYKVCL